MAALHQSEFEREFVVSVVRRHSPRWLSGGLFRKSTHRVTTRTPIVVHLERVASVEHGGALSSRGDTRVSPTCWRGLDRLLTVPELCHTACPSRLSRFNSVNLTTAHLDCLRKNSPAWHRTSSLTGLPH